jgi:hypothetical protein
MNNTNCATGVPNSLFCEIYILAGLLHNLVSGLMSKEGYTYILLTVKVAISPVTTFDLIQCYMKLN